MFGGPLSALALSRRGRSVAPPAPRRRIGLELGCGVGRITRELLRQGYRVTAVDNSPEMLAHVPTAAVRVCEDIEKLSLGIAFDAIVLASCLINISDDALRTAQLVRCREHVGSGGKLFFERHDPEWLANASVGHVGRIGTVDLYVDEVSRTESAVKMCLRYDDRGEVWLQRFTARVLDDAAVERCLSEAGFELLSWLDEHRRWGEARPYQPLQDS